LDVVAAAPTPFPELNELLGDLVARIEAILDENFVGAYLTGSFALGAGDIHSDCDFVVVLEQPLTPEQESGLRALHDEIPTRPGHWTHHLEGSYAPKADLETLAAVDREWLYIDHGWRKMQWSTHCNCEDVRWVLRERGVTVAGPDPREFVAAVGADVLRGKMPALIESFLPDLFTWTSFDIAWSQRYAVTTLCRLLYTLDTGEVGSKTASLDWAKDALAPVWRELIQQAQDERARGWDPADRPGPGSVEATVRFAEYAKERARERI
jgi:hypothetical protein